MAESSLQPADLYRHWLNVGLELGDAPNERQFLEGAIGLSAVPADFDEAAYRAALPSEEQPGHGAARALVHLAEIGAPRGMTAGLSRSQAAGLLEAIGLFQASAGRSAAALAKLEAAERLGPLSWAGLHARGDALKVLGRAREAADAYTSAVEAPGAQPKSHAAAAAALADLGDYEGAVNQLVASAAKQVRSTEWRVTAHRILAATFEANRAAAAQSWASGNRSGARGALEAALRRLVELLPAVDPLPPRLPRGRARIVVLLAEGAGGRGRVAEKRRRELSEAGWYVDRHEISQVQPQVLGAALSWAQALVVATPADPRTLHAVLTARALGIPVVLDPAPGDVPLLAGEADDATERGVMLRFVAGLSDFGLASTQEDASVIAPRTRERRCPVVPRGIDPAQVRYLEKLWLPLLATRTTVFCRVAPALRSVFDASVGPALRRVLARDPLLQVMLQCGDAGPVLTAFADRVRMLNDMTANERRQILAGADLCLDLWVPNEETPEPLWIDAATSGVPALVAQAAAELSAREGFALGDGIVVVTDSDWDGELERLLGDSALRRSQGARARAAVLSAHRPERTSVALRSALDEALERTNLKPDRRRLLLIDGRRDPDDALAWAEAVADEVGFEFAVDLMIGDNEAEAGSVRLFSRQDAILISASLAGATTPFDPVLHKLIRLTLDRLQPCLVEVRGCGALATAAVEASHSASLPFIVAPDLGAIADLPAGSLDSMAEPALSDNERHHLAHLLRSAQARPTAAEPRRAFYAAILEATENPSRTIDTANGLRDRGHYEAAEQVYERILAIDPHCHFAHYELSISRMLRSDHVGALIAVNRLLAFAPDDARAKRLAALLLHRLGGHASARALVADLHDGETEVLREFGDLLEAQPFEQALARCQALEARPEYIGAPRLLELTRDALRRQVGFAMVRLGDGEGVFINTDREDRERYARLHRANRIDRARVWFGEGADIDNMGFVEQACRIGEIVPRLDVVGIPYSARIHLEYGHLSPSDVTSMVDILHAVERNLGPHSHLCTHDIHFDLNANGLKELILEQERIGVIACHAALPDLLQRHFGVEVEFHKIPGEKLMAAEIGAEATRGEHFPVIFQHLMTTLERPLNGRLYLVSGGLLGKFYCDQIRSSGGVALDIGSLVDVWLGFRTRPGIPVEQLRL